MIDHKNLIKQIAKKKFDGFNIKQKGNSRLYLQDHYWYYNIISFQPSGFSKGTYLNVAADFNFFPREYLAFSFSEGRKEAFVSATDENFAKSVEHYCDVALERISTLNLKFETFDSAIIYLSKNKKVDSGWNLFDIGFIHALNRKNQEAKECLCQVINMHCETNWQQDRKDFAEAVLKRLNSSDYLQYINKTIAEARRLKGLDKLFP